MIVYRLDFRTPPLNRIAVGLMKRPAAGASAPGMPGIFAKRIEILLSRFTTARSAYKRKECAMWTSDTQDLAA